MKHKTQAIKNILLISLITFIICFLPQQVTAEEFNSIRGNIYINGEMINESVEIQLHFPTETLQGMSFQENNETFYNIGFLGHQNQTATIYLLYQDTLHSPDNITSFTVTSDTYIYRYDLYFTTNTTNDDDQDNDTTDDNDTEPPENQAPTANPGGSYTGTEGEQITFNGAGSSDSDGTITTYAWDFGDGDTGSGKTTTHSYNSAGTYTIKLTVTDDDGATHQKTTTATIATSNNPPTTPEITSRENVTVNTSFNITISSTDTDGDQIKFIIDWDDGTSDTETAFIQSGESIDASHTYTDIGFGAFMVSVTAVDANNAESSETMEFINVQEPTKEKADEGGFPWLYLIIIIIIVTVIIILYYLYKEDKLPISPQQTNSSNESPTVIIKEFFNTKILRKPPQPKTVQPLSVTSQTEQQPSSNLPTPISAADEPIEEEESMEESTIMDNNEEDEGETLETREQEQSPKPTENNWESPTDELDEESETGEEPEETDEEDTVFKRL